VRVLHVLEALEGGTSRHLRDVVRWTTGVEHHVAIPSTRVGAPTDRSAIPALRAVGATVHIVDMTRRPPSAANAAAVLRLRRLLYACGADIIHGHSSIGGALARLAATGTGRPRVYTPNGLHDHRLSCAVERALGPLTDALIAVSASEAASVVRRRLVPAVRLRVIPNGIEPMTGAAGPDLRLLAGIPPSAPLVLSVCRLSPQKDPATLLAALVSLLRTRTDAWGLLVGDGVLRAHVTAQIDASGLAGRLRWVPQVDEVAASLGQANVVLLLSRFEGAPYVPLEAMRAGIPVVASDVVGTRDVVLHNRTGLLVAPGDPAAAADAVLALLADPARSRALGAAGQALITDPEAPFAAATMGRALRLLYEELCPAGLS
jgi:glycosyltransferase involved in cell wall biosynthesis